MSADKTEPATEQKLRELREKGQVAQSQDFNSALSLLGALGGLLMISGIVGERALTGMAAVFGAAGEGNATSTAVASAGLVALAEAALLGIIAVAIGAIFLGIAASILQTGPLIAPKALQPNFAKLNPASNLKQKYLSPRPVIDFAKSIIKLAFVGTTLAIVMWAELRWILRLPDADLMTSSQIVGGIYRRVALVVGFLFLALAAVDIVYERWQYARDNRMSIEDVKRDQKDDYGDPRQKQQRKEMMAKLQAEASLARTAEANIVTRNPTHLAVALRYDPEKEDYPRVMTRGRGWRAKQILRIAEQEEISIWTDKPLTRALIDLEPGDQIPETLANLAQEAFRWAADEARRSGKLLPWMSEEDEEEEPEVSDATDAEPGG
ncbi:MAG: EscU/YscU/HrcU family type III secretion system export apparatus switch protein [Planctomycetota bacterium]